MQDTILRARDVYVATPEMRQDWDYRHLLKEILERMEANEEEDFKEKQPEPEQAELM